MSSLSVFSTVAAIAQVSAQAPAHTTSAVCRMPTTQSTVFTDVTVIDVTAGRAIAAQTVVVVGNRIRAIGPVQTVTIPADAHVIAAAGLYLIPGLWDMHAHVDSLADRLYPKFIAYGVTGLREMAQRFPGGTETFRGWQREIVAGTRVGPRVLGPSADLTYNVSLPTPAAAARVIDSLKAAGNIFLKFHDDNMRRSLYFAIAAAARRVGLPLVGHLPQLVQEVDASDSGQVSVEHVEENHHCWPNWPMPMDSLVPQRCAPVAAAYVRNGTWMVPTLAGAKYIDGNVQEAQKFVRLMHGFGVRMMTGTDIGIDFMMRVPLFQPGRSVLDELELLVGAGFTPAEALRAGTLNPAEFFHGTDSLGTVAVGKLADLVLLDGNPLTNIGNVRRIRAVMANGRYFDRAALDSLRDPQQVRRAPVAGNPVDTLLTLALVRNVAAVKQPLAAYFAAHPAVSDSFARAAALVTALADTGAVMTAVERVVATTPALGAIYTQAGVTPGTAVKTNVRVFFAWLEVQKRAAAKQEGASIPVSEIPERDITFVEQNAVTLKELGFTEP